MAESKVLKFPGNHIAAVTSQQMVGDLFGSVVHSRERIAFIDIDNFEEETFFRFLTRNAVTSIIDLRPKPVFERPRFHHKRTVAYLYHRDINYIEYSVLLFSLNSSKMCHEEADGKLASAVQNAIQEGLTICLFDKAAYDLGWVQKFKKSIRESRISCTEIHPRSLATS